MKISNDIIGNRTRDLPACRAGPQPTEPPGAPVVCNSWNLLIAQCHLRAFQNSQLMTQIHVAGVSMARYLRINGLPTSILGFNSSVKSHSKLSKHKNQTINATTETSIYQTCIRQQAMSSSLVLQFYQHYVATYNYWNPHTQLWNCTLPERVRKCKLIKFLTINRNYLYVQGC